MNFLLFVISPTMVAQPAVFPTRGISKLT